MEKNKFDPKLFLKLLKEKNYEELYEKFGQTAYILFADLKYKKEDKKRLINDNNYKKLFDKYGVNEPFIETKYKKHIKNLIKDGNYIDILNIYGEKCYKDYRYKIIRSSVTKESGSRILGLKYVLKEKTKQLSKDALVLFFLINLGIVGFRTYTYIDSIYDNKEVYDLYNKKLDDYAAYVKSLNIDNDLDLVMKILYDMWNETNGYGPPENEAIGIYRIAYASDNKPGVCRNLADDFTARLNAINPWYQAKTMIVDMNYPDDSLNISNIHIKPADNYDPSIFTSDEEVKDNKHVFGNHMVSTFKPIGKNYTLVVDPTNPSIGIIMNGKIYILSAINGEGLEFRPIGQTFLSLETEYGAMEIDFLKSMLFQTSNKKLEEINSLWGLESQNKSIENIKKLEMK